MGMATTTSRPRVSSRDEIQGPTLLALFVTLVALNALVAPHFSGCPPGVNDAKSRANGAETCAADASIGGSRHVALFAAAMFVGATGPLVFALPLYHPLPLVQEICMLDQMRAGRLGIGFGPGASPIEANW